MGKKKTQGPEPFVQPRRDKDQQKKKEGGVVVETGSFNVFIKPKGEKGGLRKKERGGGEERDKLLSQRLGLSLFSFLGRATELNKGRGEKGTRGRER